MILKGFSFLGITIAKTKDIEEAAKVSMSYRDDLEDAYTELRRVKDQRTKLQTELETINQLAQEYVRENQALKDSAAHNIKVTEQAHAHIQVILKGIFEAGVLQDQVTEAIRLKKGPKAVMSAKNALQNRSQELLDYIIVHGLIAN